ncbi:tyrosine-protein phosphatase non-receptor type 2-like [Bolinopsis microptera]|uniref:tyrosine-protein phosphatase non-receptor type 2-like n=1 Tax=Bolinopsis microptera TaxID=2820187 RepID=UPI00307AE0C1
MNIQDFFHKLETENRWKNDFGMLHFESYEIASRLHTSSAKSEQNRSKNRYVDVLPYDETRVRLKSANDYINASHVEPPFVDLHYICCQGPMMSTSMDFWQMIWDENTSVIIMLNRIIENNRLKCHPYWPTGEEDEDGDVDNIFTTPQYSVTLISKEDYNFYAISELSIVKLATNEERKIFHLHYYDWPDFGVPESPTKFLEFLKLVRSYYKDCKGAPVVHCSAGIGRTGTLVLVDTILTITEEKRTQNIDIYSILISIRQHRLGLVQTPDQLRFCFIAILTGMQNIDTSDFTNERISAEIDIDVESSEGSVHYMDSDDSELETDEEDDYMVDGDGSVDGSVEDEVEDEDDILINEADIAVLSKGSDKESDREDEVVSPSSIDFLPKSAELMTPDESVEAISESASPLSDLQANSDSSPEIPEVSAMEVDKEFSTTEKEEERKTRNAKTADLVSNMKEKLKAHDDSTVKKQYIWDNFGKPLLFGSAAAVGLSILIYLVR